MSRAQVLREAAQYIREHGLAKHGFGRAGGPCCVMGAVGMVERSDPKWGVSSSLYARLSRELPGNWRNVPAWNDRPERTADDVIALLERTAAKLDAERVSS